MARVNLHDILTDALLIEEILEAAQDPYEDQPVLVFDWNDQALEEFRTKIAAMVAAAAPNVAVAPFPLEAAASVHELKQGLLLYIQGLVPGCRILRGGTAGLASNLVQAMNASAVLSRLEDRPWFVAVLATVPALTTPLARILLPEPHSRTGVCDTVSLGSKLWL
jgi:hypothetical protein